jgi:hypothetical protein
MSNETDLSSYSAYYTFGNPKFSAFHPNAETGLYESFSLMFESKQACATNADQKFQMVFELTCGPENNRTQGVDFDGPLWGGFGAFQEFECQRYFEYYGPMGCETTTIAGLKTFEKFVGVIALVGGLVLCFYGAAILPIALGFLVFFMITGVVMGVGNALTDYYSGNMAPIISFAVGGCVCGAIGAFCFSKIYKEWGSALLALFGGVIVSSLLLQMVNLPVYANIIIMVIFCAVAVFLGRKFDNHVKAYGTAGVGAFLTVYGIASFFDMAPSLTTATEFDPAQLGIIAGWIVLFIAGAIVQKKYLSAKYGDVFSADI